MLNIAIAGAGIGGLAAACLLARKGHRVSVFDQFPSPGPVGSGLVIQPVGLMVLERLGLRDQAEALGARITQLVGREINRDRLILNATYGPNRHGLAMHRASLFDLLWHAALAAGVTLVPGRRITATSLVADGRLLSSLGEEIGPFDLVVDAMGAQSPLSDMNARPLPYGAVWATVPWAGGLPETQLTQRYLRADHMAGILPIGRLPGGDQNLATIFWSLPMHAPDPWVSRGFADWKDAASAFWPDFGRFIAPLSGPKDLTLARYSHGTLAKPFAERLVHIGDAAHRTSPQLGQGANMALLDALALSLALQRPGLQAALSAYARTRRSHVALYQGLSQVFTPQYQSGSRFLPILRDWVLAPMTFVPPMPRVISRIVAGDLVPPLAGVARG